jgi:hypothetical protein
MYVLGLICSMLWPRLLLDGHCTELVEVVVLPWDCSTYKLVEKDGGQWQGVSLDVRSYATNM